MGFFGFKNKHDIVPKEKDFKYILTKFSNVDSIKLNAKLVVPNGYVFVIGKKGKVCDKFEEGEYYLNYHNLPLMCRKFSLDRQTKKDPTYKMPADFYYISKAIYGGKFETYRKVEMGTKAYGFFSAKVYGVFSYRVSNVNEYLQSLLNEYDYIKTGEAETILESWVNEVVVNEMESQNFIIKDVIENNPIIAQALKIKVSKLFSVAGLELLDLKITKYKLPKEYQEQTDKNIAKESSNEQVSQENINKENKVENLQDVKLENGDKTFDGIEGNADNKNSDINQDIAEAKKLLKEFGIEKEEKSHTFLKQNCSEIKTESSNESVDGNKIIDSSEDVKVDKSYSVKKEYVPFGSFKIDNADDGAEKEKAIKKAKQKTFVDLNINELYNKRQDVKRCLNCGAENNATADHCILCGETFSKGDKYE